MTDMSAIDFRHCGHTKEGKRAEREGKEIVSQWFDLRERICVNRCIERARFKQLHPKAFRNQLFPFSSPNFCLLNLIFLRRPGIIPRATTIVAATVSRVRVFQLSRYPYGNAS